MGQVFIYGRRKKTMYTELRNQSKALENAFMSCILIVNWYQIEQ